MKTLPVVFLLSLSVVLSVCLPVQANNPVCIQPTSQGDGFFSDSVGWAYDYWDDTSSSLSAHYQFFGTSDTFQRNTAYIQFSLLDLPPGLSLLSAKLHLYLESAYRTGSTPSAGAIYHVADSSAANGQASQKLTGTELVYTVVDDPVGWLVLDVTAYVQNDLDNGYPFACFSLHADSSGDYANRYAGFSVTSADAGSNRPCLELTLIPEPTSGLLVLLALGLGGCVLRRQ